MRARCSGAQLPSSYAGKRLPSRKRFARPSASACLRAACRPKTRVAVVVGPEGGLEPDEVEMLLAIHRVRGSCRLGLLSCERRRRASSPLRSSVTSSAAWATQGIDPMRFCVVNLGVQRSTASNPTPSRPSFSARGFRAHQREESDVIVVNTCTVTGEAEKKTRKAVRALRSNDHARVVVTGCAAAIDPEAFASMNAWTLWLRGMSSRISRAWPMRRRARTDAPQNPSAPTENPGRAALCASGGSSRCTRRPWFERRAHHGRRRSRRLAFSRLAHASA